jgi:hypothetical protein
VWNNEIIDTLHMVMYRFKWQDRRIAETEKSTCDTIHKDLIEIVASNDEQLCGKIFCGWKLVKEPETRHQKSNVDHNFVYVAKIFGSHMWVY